MMGSASCSFQMFISFLFMLPSIVWSSIISVDAPLHHSTTTTECKDDEQFFFLDNTKYNCDWLRRNLEYRDIFCERDLSIRQHCKRTCLQCTTNQDRVNDEPGIIMTMEEEASWWATLHPTQAPSIKRQAGEVTLSPTTRTLSPTGCYDDRSYRYPLDQSKDCSAFVDDHCILEHEQELSRNQLQDFLSRCPRACNVPCNYTLNTSRPTITPRTSRPTRSRTNRPTISPTISTQPTDCFDDRSYTSPLDPNKRCEDFEDCFSYRDRLTLDQYQEFLLRCPMTCKVGCNYQVLTDAPTISSSPSSVLSQRPTFGELGDPNTMEPTPSTPSPTNAREPTSRQDDPS